MGRTRRLIVAGLGAGLSLVTGCLPGANAPWLSAFEAEPGSCAAAPGSVEVEVEPGALSIRGAFTAPTPCHTLHPTLISSNPRHVTLVIVARESDGVCVQCLAAIPYAARIEGLSGHVRFRVLHGEDPVVDGWHDVPPP